MAKRIIIYIFLLLFCLASLCSAQDITLKWKANTEYDLAGYKIYYKTDYFESYNIATPPEDIISQGLSPIIITILDENDPNYMENINPEFMLNGLDLTDKDYYLVVTAFDDEEPVNESGYSNEVNTIDDPVDPPPGSNNDSDGGCFISVCDSVD